MDEDEVPLCSKDDASLLISSNVSNLHAPIFVLDISLGPATNPIFGDAFLSNIDARRCIDIISV